MVGREARPIILVLAVALAAVLNLGARVSAAPPGEQRPAAEQKALAERHERVARLSGEVLAGSEIKENLRALCDDIGGRLAGTESGRKARELAASILERYGLKDVHEEPFRFLGWTRETCACEVTSPRPLALHAVALGNTPSTDPGGMEAEVIDASHGNPVELDRLGEALKGKFALVSDDAMPGGRWMHRSEIMAEVAKRGAAGLLYQTTEAGELPMTGMCWQGGVSPIPAVGISKEDGEWIKRQLASGESVAVRLQMTNHIAQDTCANVVGEIPGRGDEFVILGAHLDAWDIGQGAIDNGTGTVVVLEAARALMKSGTRPQAAIRVVLFMGEELGLCGSRAYAVSHERELSRCRAMINCDMTGMPLGIRVMGHNEAEPFFEELLNSLQAFELSAGISHRPGIYGDQQPFLLGGVPVVMPISRFTDESERYYHTSGDTYDKVTFGQLHLEAAFIAAVALELAWPERRIMDQLDEKAVSDLIKEYHLDEVLSYWGDGFKRN
jgi:Iap family predicted aminopeptidase